MVLSATTAPLSSQTYGSNDDELLLEHGICERLWKRACYDIVSVAKHIDFQPVDRLTKYGGMSRIHNSAVLSSATVTM